MSRTWQPLRFRSRQSHHRLVETSARWRTRAGLGLTQVDPHVANHRRRPRLRPEYAFRKVSREDSESAAQWRSWQERQDRIRRYPGLSQEGFGGLDLRRLPRFSSRLHVSNRMSV